MFQLDEKFLEDIGLGSLPEEQKKPFLRHIYDELELRVGTKLSDGMSDEQLGEFESIIDRKSEVIDNWLANKMPGYMNDEVFKKLQENTGLNDQDPSLKAEYAASKWLEVNRPDYKDVVAKTLDELKQEIINNKDAILGNSVN